jgi:hypothetical protein
MSLFRFATDRHRYTQMSVFAMISSVFICEHLWQKTMRRLTANHCRIAKAQ